MSDCLCVGIVPHDSRARAFPVCMDQPSSSEPVRPFLCWHGLGRAVLDEYSSGRHGESLLKAYIILTSVLLCMSYGEGKRVDCAVQWLGSQSQISPAWISSDSSSSVKVGRCDVQLSLEESLIYTCVSHKSICSVSSPSAKSKSRCVSAGNPWPLHTQGATHLEAPLQNPKRGHSWKDPLTPQRED